MKGTLTSVKDAGSVILNILLGIYWVLLVPYIEEWFWREWIWHNLYIDRIWEKIWVALTWGTMYAALLLAGGGASGAIACAVILAIIGYLLAPLIRYEYSYNASFLIHVGANGGIAICWYFASTGKF